VSHDLSSWRRKGVVFSASTIPSGTAGAKPPYG
jgi:hypothetical protein